MPLRFAAAAIIIIICISLVPLPSIEKTSPVISVDQPSILWTYNLTSNSYGGAAIGDIDLDGKFEVVFGTYMGDEHLYALNGEDGSLLWSMWAGPGPLDASVKLVDLTGDGRLEVVYATSGSFESGAGVLHVLHGENGSVLWEYNPDTCTDSPPAIVDIDNDSRFEILYGTFHDGLTGGYVHILNGEDGSLVDIVGPFPGYIQSGPSVVDLNGDAQLDFVIAMYAGDDRIYAVDGSDYSILWNYTTGDSMYHGCSIANLDDDEYPEVVIGSYDGNVYAIHGENGSLLWDYTGTFSYYIVSIADLDGDYYPEIIAAGTLDVIILNHDGSLLWSENIIGSFRGAAVADMEGDDDLDVIIGDGVGVMTVLQGDTGDILWEFDAALHFGATPFDIDHGPSIADLNADGILDIFFVGGRGYSDDPENNYGCAYAISLGPTGERGWPMFRHDYYNSGNYNSSIPSELYIHVIDAQTGVSIPDAIVQVDSQILDVLANNTYVSYLPEGAYGVNVSCSGYISYLETMTLIGGAIHRLNISLVSLSTSSVSNTTSLTTFTTSATSVTSIFSSSSSITSTSSTPATITPDLSYLVVVLIVLVSGSLSIIALILIQKRGSKQ